MSEKCCGNCKHFQNESATGNGWCNEHELTDELIDRAVIGWRDSCNRQHIVAFTDCAMGVGTMAKYGGYWYYVLPELKIE